MANEVFISYSRSDYSKVKDIKDAIDREVGIDCWMDLEGIESDKQFVDVIINAINRNDTMLFMMSKDSMKSKWALRELAFAENKEKRIVLVRLDNAKMPDKFSFLYGGKDQITWSNSLQRNKLIQNLSNWFPAKSPQNAYTAPMNKKGGYSVIKNQITSFLKKFVEIPFRFLGYLWVKLTPSWIWFFASVAIILTGAYIYYEWYFVWRYEWNANDKTISSEEIKSYTKLRQDSILNEEEPIKSVKLKVTEDEPEDMPSPLDKEIISADSFAVSPKDQTHQILEAMKLDLESLKMVSETTPKDANYRYSCHVKKIRANADSLDRATSGRFSEDIASFKQGLENISNPSYDAASSRMYTLSDNDKKKIDSLKKELIDIELALELNSKREILVNMEELSSPKVQDSAPEFGF